MTSNSGYIHSSELTPHDVLTGRGPRIQNHPGNRLFRTIVASRQHDYTHAAKHRDKQIIAQELVDYIRGRSGMQYSLGDGTGRCTKGDVVYAVEDERMSGGLAPGGRFLELVVQKDKSDKKKASPSDVIVAYPDLWRPVDDNTACEKIKQAFRNLSKGLISDPKVQSAYSNSTDTSNGTAHTATKNGESRLKVTGKQEGRGKGRSRLRRSSGTSKGTSKTTASSNAATSAEAYATSRDVSSTGFSLFSGIGTSTALSASAPLGPLHVGARDRENVDISGINGVEFDSDTMPFIGLSAAMDLNLDAFDEFGSIEELAESLELLESGAANDSNRNSATKLVEGGGVNPVVRGASASSRSDLPCNSSASHPTSCSEQIQSVAADKSDPLLQKLRQCLNLAEQVECNHAVGQTLWPADSLPSAGTGAFCLRSRNAQDLVKLGETIYKEFAGFEPGKRKPPIEMKIESNDACSDAYDNESVPSGSKRRSLGTTSPSGSDDIITQYIPLREMGLPTSLCVCVESLLNAADIECEERYASIDQVKADLELMLAKPDRFFFDRSLLCDGVPGKLSASSIGDGLSFPNNKLYGRDQQLTELASIFQRVIVTGGQREFVEVTGYAGTGKTTFVDQLRKPLAAKGGNFITAKFDKLGHIQPMQVIFNAFDEYFKEISGIGGCSRKTPEVPNLPCYCSVREAICNSLRSNGTVLTDLMPNLRHVLSEELLESRTVEVGAVEALNRFVYFFRLLVRAISSASSPVILFLDDLQWADSAALELLSTLVSDTEVKNLLFISAYRGEEIVDHPVSIELARLRSSGIKMTSLSLGNMEEGDLNAFISDTLHLSPRITIPLSELVSAKTTGNILFTIELLRSLNEEGMLRYSARHRRWEWNAEMIKARPVDDNVVGLLTKKMLNLSSKKQWVLRVAACLGPHCESNILKQLLVSNQHSNDEIKEAIGAACKEGYLNQVGSIYHFTHDQIVQACYNSISVQERQALHLSIGRTLWRDDAVEKIGDHLELIVDQLNRGEALITDQSERIKVANLCLAAGQKAMASSAFLLASTYLLQGTAFLDEDSWNAHYDLTLELYSSCAEAQYATGNHEGVSLCVNPIMNHGRSLQDKMRAYYTLLNSLGAKGQQRDAITCGMGLLKALGLVIPISPEKNAAIAEFQQTQDMLHGANINEIPMRDHITNAGKYAAVKALYILVRHAHSVNQMLMSIMICRIVQLSMIYGVSKESSFAFATYGFLLSKYVSIDEACHFGRIALNLLERFDAKDVLARVTCVLNDFLIFKEPLQSRLPSLKSAYEIGLQMGDIEWALTDANIYVLTAIQSGRKLPLLADELKTIMQQMRLYKHHTLIVAMLYNRVVVNLMQETNNPTELDIEGGEFASISQEVKQVNIVNRACFLRLWIAYLFGDYSLAAEMAERRWEMTKSRPFRSSSLANETFYTGLIAVMMAKKEAPADAKWKDIALTGRDELQKWISYSNWNFQHKMLLLNAEILFHLNDDYDGAAKLYEDAIRNAQKHSFLSEEALSYERAAMFHDFIGNHKKAVDYLNRSLEGYKRWGALSKVAFLKSKIESAGVATAEMSCKTYMK